MKMMAVNSTINSEPNHWRIQIDTHDYGAILC